ncbi:ubiquinone biosynthesis regulatory protein kinase UbiB [Spectribacter hydrogenoxidans]|uniref:Ubiquinone biosynthesis regulatory protein kinase UbiB n=1 Tax=Spectribacter hydrogenoxidans TaxID=3075608 RepID=A0ABU3BX02_9GAMM|nr:ubiquinone biosynthesis regulatory protein kinase UbiB [Salinisphaera sp. W335]MDT0633790.1 ubiquinone biosynthesis regulatory protein kinase UbiB [Salinisphaera sp. W335]
MLERTRRLWQIRRIARRYGLGELVPDRRARWVLGSGRGHEQPLGVRLRLALEELGPIFVKFGQAVSTRRDLLPPELAEELVKLQDQVPPFDGGEAAAIVERAYGCRLGEVFAEFDREPLAAASIAQVHTARLHPAPGDDDGMSVVVKVLRPGVKAAIDRDVALMYLLADLAMRLPELARLRPREVVAEYDRIIHDELDLVREGANASELRRNWQGSDLIYHPVVLFDHTRDNVLVMERIHGIPIDDVEALTAAGVDFRVLAERGVEIFFKQVFRDNFFHADMHPGNIFVDASNPDRPRYIGVDFGIVGSLTPSDQRYLAENFLAFFNRDYRRIAELHVASGWMPADTRIEAFEAAIRTVSEPIFNKPLAEISFGLFLIRLFQIARQFDYRVQPQLVLLQKTVLNVEGLGRDLYPQLDLWQTAKPVLEEWMRERLDPRRTLARLQKQLPQLLESLPALTEAAVARLEAPGREPAATPADAAPSVDGAIRIGCSVLGAGLAISAVLAAGLAVGPAWTAPVLGLLAALAAWRAVRRPG